MDAAKSITATFAINTYALDVATVGNGTVAKSPDQPSYEHGSSDELTATPAAGFHFTGWSGDASGSDHPLSVAMDAAKHITATFAINTYTITASADANGTIAPSGAVSVNHGDSQSFTATPGTGYHVADVTVDGGSVDAVASYTFINVTADHTIAASFAINTYALDLATVGNGTVAKSPDQPSYEHGSSVELTATPAAGFHFTGWSGDASGSDNPLNVVMDAAKHITATFAINTYTLTATTDANGTIAQSPAHTVNHRDTKSQTATTPTADLDANGR